MKVRVLHSPYKSGKLRRYDDGGDMSSEIEGLRSINEGGTHEENPLGGVPQGYADDGGQNLVEEGEVIYDDYVYSDRLSPSLRELDSFSLPKKYGGKTFAEIAKKLSDEAEERPNDPISQSGLDSNMGRLRDLQEEHKAQKEAERQEAYERGLADAAARFQQYGYPQRVPDEATLAMQPGLSERIAAGGIDGLYQEPEEHEGAYGMHLHDGTKTEDTSSLINGSYDWDFDKLFANVYQDANNKSLYIPYYQSGAQTWYTGTEKKWSELSKEEKKAWVKENIENTEKYKAFNKYVKDNWDSEAVRKYLKELEKRTGREFKNYDEWEEARIDGVMGYVHETPEWIEAIAEEAEQEAASEETPTPQPEEPAPPAPEGEPEKKKEEETKPEPYEPLPEWMRYAPIAGSALGAMNAWLSPPDHEYSDNLRNNANIPLRQAVFRPTADYLTYRPLDDQYLANQIMAQANANRAAMSMGTRATGNTIAGFAALNRNAAKAIGDAYIQMADKNMQNRQTVANFNKNTNQYNSTGLYTASAANAELAANRDQYRANLLAGAYAARDKEDKEVEQSRSAALTNLANNLGELGLENRRINMANSNPALFGLLYPNGIFNGATRLPKKEDEDEETTQNGKFGGKLSHKYTSLRLRKRGRR